MSCLDPILTIKEVAIELRCSANHVSNLMNGKVKGALKLPYLPLGRKKVVRRSAFETWKLQVERNMLPPDSESKTVDAVH